MTRLFINTKQLSESCGELTDKVTLYLKMVLEKETQIIESAFFPSRRQMNQTVSKTSSYQVIWNNFRFRILVGYQGVSSELFRIRVELIENLHGDIVDYYHEFLPIFNHLIKTLSIQNFCQYVLLFRENYVEFFVVKIPKKPPSYPTEAPTYISMADRIERYVHFLGDIQPVSCVKNLAGYEKKSPYTYGSFGFIKEEFPTTIFSILLRMWEQSGILQIEGPLVYRKELLKNTTVLTYGANSKCCVFCSPKILHNQMMMQCGRVFILVNYAPYAGTKAHFLILPVRHVDRWSELNDEELEEILNVRKSLLASLRSISENIVSFSQNGVQAGQNVWHVHLHVLDAPPLAFFLLGLYRNFCDSTYKATYLTPTEMHEIGERYKPVFYQHLTAKKIYGITELNPVSFFFNPKSKKLPENLHKICYRKNI